MAGLDFFRDGSELAKTFFSGCEVHHFLQTNGLLLSEEYCEFFRDQGFQIGISLDGPHTLHDTFRHFANGKGSHRQVVEKLKLAREYNLGVGFNAVITDASLGREHEIYVYFQELGAGFRANPAIPASCKAYGDSYLLHSGEYGEFLCRLLEEWLTNEQNRVAVSPLDIYLKAIVNNTPQECQQQPSCVGSHLAIKPSGDAVLCSKFTTNFLGNVHKNKVEEMYQTQFCKEITQRLARLTTCHSCEHWSVCHGGCPHNGLVFYNDHTVKDYFCKDYKRIFSTLRNALSSLTEDNDVGKGP